MNREGAVLATLIAYKLGLIFIGFYYRRRTHNDLDFYLGGRKLGPLVTAISASASSSSAWTLLGVSGAAYLWGLSALWLFPSCVGGFLLNWYLLAPNLQKESRRLGAITITDVLAGEKSSSTQKLIAIVSSLIILVSLGTYVSSQFQGAGKAFSETFEVSITSSILIGAGIVILYTFLGGFWAVSVTDTLQGLLMAITAVVLPLTALFTIGPSEFWGSLDQVQQPGFLSLTRNLLPVSAIGFILGLLGIGLGYPGQPHVINRFMALESSEKSLFRARNYAIVWAVVVYSGMLLLGFCGRILSPHLSDPEVVFISLTNQLFPPMISGIMIAAVLSAIMSTADSQLLVASSSVSHDLGMEKHTPLSRLTLSRLTVLAISIGAVIGAILGSREIFTQVLFAWAAMGSAFGPVLLVQLLVSPVPARARLACIIIGFGSSVLSFYLFPGDSSWKGAMERSFPFLLTFLIAFFAACKHKSRNL